MAERRESSPMVPGDDDERQVESARVQQIERIEGVEARHGEVGEYDVPGPLFPKRRTLAHGLGGFDARACGAPATLTQLFDQ